MLLLKNKVKHKNAIFALPGGERAKSGSSEDYIMKNKILGIWNYLLCGFLGFWGLAFMSTSACVSKAPFMQATMYELIDFTVSAALSATAVFEIIMIIISCIMLVLFLVQLLKLHSVKINCFNKLFEIRIKIVKKIDLVTLLAFSYTLMSLLTLICTAVFCGEISFSIGFGPIWIFISSVLVSLAMFFKDLILRDLTNNTANIAENKTETVTDDIAKNDDVLNTEADGETK